MGPIGELAFDEVPPDLRKFAAPAAVDRSNWERHCPFSRDTSGRANVTRPGAIAPDWQCSIGDIGALPCLRVKEHSMLLRVFAFVRASQRTPRHIQQYN